MSVSNPVDVHRLLVRATVLQAEFRRLTGVVERVHTWKVIFVHAELWSASKERREIEARADQLYTDMNDLMSHVAIALPIAMVSAGSAVGMQMTMQLVELVKASRASAQCVLAIQRLQEASSGLGALIERKYAYAFAFISLYVGLASTLFSTWYSMGRPSP